MDYVRSGKALAKVIEYAGEAVEELSVDERATLTNMAAEIGGFTGIVAPDEKVVDFLVERRGMDRAQAQKLIAGLQSDPDAEYAHVIEMNADEIYPMVATPGDPGNGKFVRDLNTPGADRDRLRRHLHRRQERRHGHVRARARRTRSSRAGAWPTR